MIILFNFLKTIANGCSLPIYPLWLALKLLNDSVLVSRITRIIRFDYHNQVAIVVFLMKRQLMQLFYASVALDVRDQSRANPLSFRILRAPFIRVSAHLALWYSTMRAHHLGLARGETAADKHSINIYIYTLGAKFIAVWISREKVGGRNERSSCVTKEIISSVRSTMFVFFIRVDAEKERKRRRRKIR